MSEAFELCQTKKTKCPKGNNHEKMLGEYGMPYVELRKGKKYGEIWFETPCDIAFNPKAVFDLKEWYESYWLKRRQYKGLHPYRFCIGPTAIWFKFTLDDLDLIKEQLMKLTWWDQASRESRNLTQIKDTSNKIFWNYAEKYFEKSRSIRRHLGQKAYL